MEHLPLWKLLRNAVSGSDIIYGARFFVVRVVRFETFTSVVLSLCLPNSGDPVSGFQLAS